MKCFRWITLWGISTAALLCCSAAHGDTFSFTFSGSGFNGTGSFTATPASSPTVPGQYVITGMLTASPTRQAPAQALWTTTSTTSRVCRAEHTI
jgi:hypothetical protein